MAWKLDLRRYKMALLVLRKEEIEVLSLLSRVKINSFSVLKGMEGFDEETIKSNKEEHKVVISDFAKDGAIWKDEKGKLRLIRELQGVFKIINAPEKTYRIKSSSNRALREHYYSKIGELGVLFSVGKDGAFFNIGYPFKDQLISTWFNDEIIGDLGIKEEEKKDFSLDFNLLGDEFNIMILSLLIQKNLNKDDFKIEDLLKEEVYNDLERDNFFDLNVEKYKENYDENKFKKIIDKLVDKKVFEASEEGYKVKNEISSAFEIDNIRDIVEISEITPFMRGKNFYITNKGFMYIEPVISPEPEWNIKLEGLKTKTYDLFKKAIDFNYIKPSDKLKEELKRHM
jgi:hypothetical protein